MFQQFDDFQTELDVIFVNLRRGRENIHLLTTSGIPIYCTDPIVKVQFR